MDGETDWKLRKAPSSTQERTDRDLINLDGYIQYEAPNKLIYNFLGVIKYKNNQGVINE